SDSLSERLLIDIQGDPRKKTTRLSQATDSMQLLFFALHNHEFEQLVPQSDVSSWTLNEDPVTFDEECGWMGTYSRWQSVMLVFLYPENTLLPSLRLDATLPVPGETTLEPQAIAQK